MTLEVSKKYSKALIQAYEDSDKIDDLVTETKSLLEIVAQTDLIDFLQNYSFSDEDKKKIIAELAGNFSPMMKNFLGLLEKNKRVSILDKILEQTIMDIEDIQGLAQVEVISAVQLDEEQLAKAKRISANKFNLKEVEIQNIINKDIIGGMIIKSRGKIIDMSIKSQLAKIAQEIR